MTWLILVLFSALTISVANVFRRVTMREKDADPLASTIIFQFIVACITFIFALIVGFRFPPVFKYPLNFVLSSIFWALSSYTFFYAAKYLEASRITIIWSLGAVIAIIAGVLTLGESFTIYHALGTLAILFSVFLISGGLKFELKKGDILAFLATSFAAIAVTSDTFILKHYDAISFTPVISLLPGILLLIVYPKSILLFKKLTNTKYLKNISLVGFFYGIQAIAYYSALNLGANISQVSPISKIEIIFTVFLGVVFLKERKNIKTKIVATVIAVIGVILLR